MSDLFVITGGGTGAKVAESLAHLCAAGLGPKRLHLLMIDSDTANGNLRRAASTIAVYQQMQRWPWTVNASVSLGMFRGSEDVALQLFRTEIEFYSITDEIKTVLDGGLETSVESEEMHDVLDLLYDRSEQQATCEDGFRARPNLGCLLMSEHLRHKLPEKGMGFLNALRAAASAGQRRIPVVVTASVFGGTGASLIPIIRGCVERALNDANTRDALVWSVVKMLPHYQPTEKKESVDPDRYLLDTANALRFYSTVYETTDANQRYDAMYVVGSDNPGRNRVKAVLGHSAQANPSYFEEVIAALAILHQGSTSSNGMPTYLYQPSRLHWDHLPFADRNAFRTHLAYLMHLAAFYLHGSTEDDRNELERGLARFLATVPDDSLRAYPWYRSILEPWAESHSTFKSADAARRVEVLKSTAQMGDRAIDKMKRPAAAYFGRILLWAETALAGEGLRFIDRSNGSYAFLYEAMSNVSVQEIDVVQDASGEVRTVETETDNALVRLMRTALAALVQAHTRASHGGARNRGVALLEKEVIRTHTTLQQVKDSLHDFGLGGVIEEYTRTKV